MTEESAIRQLEDSLVTLLGDLRGALEWNDNAFAQACDALTFLARQWYGQSVVPRRVVPLVLNVVGMILGIAQGIKQDEIRYKLEQGAAELDERIQACFLDGEYRRE